MSNLLPLKNSPSQFFKEKDTTLVVGDVHIAPNQNLRRASWLGYAIECIQPSRVLFIGDFITFDSLSDWDKDKRKKMEGRRYKKDIDSGRKFLELMDKEIKTAKPKYIFIEGNHENRLERYCQYDPTFDGMVDYRSDLGIKDWVFVPYKEFYKHRGVYFTHIPINEGGKPLGGKYATHRALEIVDGSVVFGHTHKLVTACVHRHGSNYLSQSLNVGCFFEHIDDYALGSVTSYWRGLILINHYANNEFDYSPIRMGRLKKNYEEHKHGLAKEAARHEKATKENTKEGRVSAKSD